MVGSTERDEPVVRRRVYQVAQQMGMSSKELLERLSRMGVRVRSATSPLDESTVARLRSVYLAERIPPTATSELKSKRAVPDGPEKSPSAKTKPRGRRTAASRSVAKDPAFEHQEHTKAVRSNRGRPNRTQGRGKSRREKRQADAAITPAGPGRWHVKCPLCWRWVEVQDLWGVPDNHRSCSPHDYVESPKRYAWMDPSIHGSRPPEDNIRWRPVGRYDPGMSYRAALLAAGSDTSVEFVGWARTPVTETGALRETRNRTVPSLRRLIGQLEALPKRLVNPQTERRLRIAKQVLERHEQAHEAALDRQRQPRRGTPKRVSQVVRGGLPTLGRR